MDKEKEMKEIMFMPDGKTPRCPVCKKAMKRYIPTEGEFKGQLQEHSWVCECEPNLIMSVG